MFWRIQQVIKVTANALRQQIINREARRLDKEIKSVLDDLSDDEDRKVQLLVGKRVTLAEELSKHSKCNDSIILSKYSVFFFFFFLEFSSGATDSRKTGGIYQRPEPGEIDATCVFLMKYISYTIQMKAKQSTLDI